MQVEVAVDAPTPTQPKRHHQTSSAEEETGYLQRGSHKVTCVAHCMQWHDKLMLFYPQWQKIACDLFGSPAIVLALHSNDFCQYLNQESVLALAALSKNGFAFVHQFICSTYTRKITVNAADPPTPLSRVYKGIAKWDWYVLVCGNVGGTSFHLIVGTKSINLKF